MNEMILTPVFRRGIMRSAVSVLLFPALITSCLDITADVEIRPSGGVFTTVQYTLPGKIAEFGRGFGADEPWPLPLTEKEFRRLALRREGVELRGYRVKTRGDEGDVVRVTLHAEDFEAMAGFFGWNGNLLSDENGGELKFAFPPPENLAVLKAEDRDVLESLFAEGRFELRVKTPGKPRTVQGGSRKGRRAVFTLNFSDVLTAESPSAWSVRW